MCTSHHIDTRINLGGVSFVWSILPASFCAHKEYAGSTLAHPQRMGNIQIRWIECCPDQWPAIMISVSLITVFGKGIIKIHCSSEQTKPHLGRTSEQSLTRRARAIPSLAYVRCMDQTHYWYICTTT